MQIRRISIYEDFQCTGAACPVSCCRGWRVPIDEEMYKKYLTEKGIFGTVLRCLIEKKDDIVSFRNTVRGCPFWGTDRLCSLQKKSGTQYMPLVCVQFPRQLCNFGFFCEETLYLACPEAARLFLKAAAGNQPFVFHVTEGEVRYEVNTTNDDEEFLRYLLQARTELIQMLDDGISFDSMAFLQYGRDAQNACLSRTPLPSPLYYNDKNRYIFDCTMMNQLFFNGFYHPSLKTLSPFLYRLCRKYIKSFCGLNRRSPDAANRRLAALEAVFRQKIPDSDKLLNQYYAYYLQTSFLDIFEDYSFSKHLLFGIAKANMLWVFIALYAEKRSFVTTEELARIIAVYERRAPQLEDALKHITA
ncbi:MAG: flagellin lysine-N-methylase [Lachnospiraceae bacterium]|nr:flagellin lysine-N-methylase [Lachnospiraceae bacterium]